MQTRRISRGDSGQRTFAIVLDTDDEVMGSLKRFVEREKLSFGQFSAIGAFRSARLGYFDWERKEYSPIPVAEQVEVASLIGISRPAPMASRRFIFIVCWAVGMAVPLPVICWRLMCAQLLKLCGGTARRI